MDKKTTIAGHFISTMDRRRFITSCSACTAWAALSSLTGTGCTKPREEQTSMRIRIIYSLHAVRQPGPDWPNVGFDFGPVMEHFNQELTDQFPEFEFLSSMAAGPEEAAAILKQDQSSEPASAVDGYIVFQLNCWNRVVQTIADSKKPVLYVDFKYGGSGGFLVYNAEFLRKHVPNVAFIASSKSDDLLAAVKCFAAVRNQDPPAFVQAVTRSRIERTPKPGDLTTLQDKLAILSPEECLRRMSESRILAVRDEDSGPLEPIMGIPLEKVSFAEVNEAWKAADPEESKKIAERWITAAEEVAAVPREVIEASAAMYLGMKSVLKKHDANAITMNCLGGFYGGHIHAYPCLGFHELCNEGLIGACECDIPSTATMTAFTAMSQGRPGFISDPVIDTSLRQIIYAHCVATNKVFGPQGPTNSYKIMTHSEDRQGASVRSILPLGYLTTTMRINQQRKEIILHQGKAVANDPDDRACRTKLCVEPIGDIEKLFTMWDQWGWHRVTFYGDLKEAAYSLADAMGWKVIEEA